MTTRVRVAVVGAGFAGIGTALRLRASGEDSFVVVERGASVGGTWRDNTYPGVACDVPSHLYCYSFLPNPWFSRRFAEGHELRDYLERAADPIRDRLLLSTTMTRTSWDKHTATWLVETDRGDVVADAVVMACGRLSEPRGPQVDGAFDGPVVHSARWDDDLDLTGLRVGLVGTGASAVQLLPHLAREAASVTVLQRSAPYVLPREDEVFATDQQERWADDPALLASVRADLHADAERGHAARVADGPMRQALVERARAHRERLVADVALREALTPDYAFGCKRPVFSDAYYPALTADHVALVTSPLASLEPGAMVAADGSRHEVDVVVLATGFESTRQPYAHLVHGRDGELLADHWAGGMRAYASTSVSGFPNLFVVNGPNASLGHSSSVLMIEAQVEYVLAALEHVGPGLALDVRADAEAAYVGEMDRRSRGAVWTSGCSSWYLDPGSGRQVLLYPGRADEFAARMARFDVSAYEPVAATGRVRVGVAS